MLYGLAVTDAESPPRTVGNATWSIPECASAAVAVTVKLPELPSAGL